MGNKIHRMLGGEVNRMRVLELFAGTRSIGTAFENRGHQVYSVEWDKAFSKIDLYEDILNVQASDILDKFGRPDVIWASPDCSTYSIAAISHHRIREKTGNLLPMSGGVAEDGLYERVAKIYYNLLPIWRFQNEAY